MILYGDKFDLVDRSNTGISEDTYEAPVVLLFKIQSVYYFTYTERDVVSYLS